MINHILLICFILGLSVFILFFIATTTTLHPHRKTKSNICRGYLTDKEYLEHMIPHHQVALDISILLQKKNKRPRNAGHIKKVNMGSKLRNTINARYGERFTRK